MSDGHRKITLELTEAQHDILQEAAKEIITHWQNTGTELHKRNTHTLARAMQKFDNAWQQGRKR